ncbi:hypothetical protein Chor_009600 [Crotalus horridus]
MALKLLINFLIVFPACTTSEITITQSAAQVKRPGERMRFTCTVSGFSLGSSGISWIRQVSGKELEWIGDIWHNGGTAYSTMFRSQASITKDNSRSQVILQLNALKAEDTAIYYCIRHNDRNLPSSWSKTTAVQI